MGKYAPLNEHLKAQNKDYLRMTFADIEQVVGERLPASKQYPAWWSNNPSNNVMTREWLTAGYETEQVDIAGEKLVFRKVRKSGPNTPAAAMSKTTVVAPSGFGEAAQAELNDAAPQSKYAIFGCMKGTLTLHPNMDLGTPDEETIAWLDRKYGRG